jgi:hypothetical protein
MDKGGYHLANQPHCPSCGKTLDGATSCSQPDKAIKPDPGDVTICFYCHAYLRFGTELDLRLLDADEFNALPYTLRKALDTARGMLKRRGPPMVRATH